MPFSGPSSYLPTTDEFIAHWTDVNAALSPGNVTLSGPFNLASLTTARGNLATAITELEAAINVLEGHRTDRDNRKAAIKERMRQLGFSVRGLLADSANVGQVPRLPDFNESMGKWIIAMDDFAHIWTTINATPPAGFTPPLLLTGAYTAANFATDVAALKTTFTGISTAEVDVDRERDERDQIYLTIRDQLVRYRDAVQGAFAEGHALIESLPRLVPLPGHTPDAVVLSGVWNAGTSKADLSWTASDDPDLASYSVRRSGATPYDAATEVVVDTVLPGGLALSTNSGLTVSGTTMGYKVYVVLSTGNERGSNAVSVTFPPVVGEEG